MMSGSQAPGLSRAIAECTQPYGPQLSGDLMRTLQVWLRKGHACVAQQAFVRPQTLAACTSWSITRNPQLLAHAEVPVR